MCIRTFECTGFIDKRPRPCPVVHVQIEENLVFAYLFQESISPHFCTFNSKDKVLFLHKSTHPSFSPSQTSTLMHQKCSWRRQSCQFNFKQCLFWIHQEPVKEISNISMNLSVMKQNIYFYFILYVCVKVCFATYIYSFVHTYVFICTVITTWIQHHIFRSLWQFCLMATIWACKCIWWLSAIQINNT